MAKSTNGGRSTGTNGEAKARRAPARRRVDRQTSGANEVVASAADLARTAATPEAQSPAATAGTGTIELGAVGDPSPEEVRRRAYEIYVGRGGTDGSDVEDWYEAERQLKSPTH